MNDQMNNVQCTMTDQQDSVRDEGKKTPKYDLGERTALLGENVILYARTIAIDAITSPLIKQLVRSATSVGANYCEANDAGSKKEFLYRISVCNREVRETKHWLRMLAVAFPTCKDCARLLWKESHELNLIFSSIYRKGKTRP
jgi:four helix bundle protein